MSIRVPVKGCWVLLLPLYPQNGAINADATVLTSVSETLANFSMKSLSMILIVVGFCIMALTFSCSLVGEFGIFEAEDEFGTFEGEDVGVENCLDIWSKFDWKKCIGSTFGK